MAVWQVSFFLVKDKGVIDFTYSDFVTSLKSIESVFPEEKSWCKTIKQYGELDSTCLEIDTEDGSISVRIDLRSITKEELQILCDFIKENHFLIKYNEAVYEGSIDSFLEIFRVSDANRFLSAPVAYLEEICE